MFLQKARPSAAVPSFTAAQLGGTTATHTVIVSHVLSLQLSFSSKHLLDVQILLHQSQTLTAETHATVNALVYRRAS